MKTAKNLTLLTCLLAVAMLAGFAWSGAPADAEDCCFGSHTSSQQWVIVQDCADGPAAIEDAAWDEADATCGDFSSPCNVQATVEECHLNADGTWTADGYITFGCFDPVNCTLTP